jgi:DNA processing protein
LPDTRHSPEIEKWLWLIRAEGVGPVLFRRLVKTLGSVDKVLGASVAQLTKVEGVGVKTAERIARTRGQFDAVGELQAASKLGVCVICLDDPRYPVALRQIYDPPVVLYVKGSLRPEDNLAVAVVGSRRCSQYGLEQANRFAHFLAGTGFTVVSGGARGIDSAAHRGALSAKGRTIVVQGCGLAHLFPPENKELFERIAENGAIISELPLAYEPLSENFPGRNRIIAGLAIGTLVVEASLNSGALITAQASLDNNREVMAIPGLITNPACAGSHKLIKQGARLIDSIEELMDALGCIGQELKQPAARAVQEAEKATQKMLFDVSELNLSESERKVYACFDDCPLHLEELIALTDLPAGTIYAATVSLQLKGLVKQLAGNMFVRRLRAD